MRADGYLLPRRATLLAMSGVLLGMLLAALNQTIVATALPRIVGDLGGMEHYSWVFTAYMLAGAIHPVFVIGGVLMAVTLAIVIAIPELPLRRTVREVPA